MMTSVAAVSPTPDARWLAVQGRDARADGRFVYAVTSTGIYCRPSCPSRRPRADRVAYFPTPDAAERAGFRACRRCDPRASRSVPEQKVERARVWIETHPDLRPSLARLARVAGVSPWHLQRIVQAAAGRDAGRVRAGSPGRASETRAQAGSRHRGHLRGRLRVAQPRLRRGRGRAGDDAPGVSGGRPRRADSLHDPHDPAGRDAGGGHRPWSCRVALGDDPAALEQRLRDEFPAADVRRDRAGLEAARLCAARGRRRPAGRQRADARRARHGLSAPGLACCCRRFPAGETRTYAEVARQLGSPRSARAVARACATNPVALAVPCHRVVPAAGGTGGYRWGSERKKKLLADEARNRRLLALLFDAGVDSPPDKKRRWPAMPVRYGQSPWAAQLPKTSRPTYPKLIGRLDIPIVIVGGGLTGCATAYALAAAGHRVALVEAGQIAAGRHGTGRRAPAGLAGADFLDLEKAHGLARGTRAVAGHASRVAGRAGDAAPPEDPLQPAALRCHRRRTHRRAGHTAFGES